MNLQNTPDKSFAGGILDYLPDAIIWVNPIIGQNGVIDDFQVRYANKAASALVNHPKGDLYDLLIRTDGVPSKEGAEANFSYFLEVYKSGEVKEYSFYAHHSGQQIETIRRPYEGGVLSTSRDRKAQREAERKEQEKSELLNGLIQHAPVGIEVYESIRDSSGAIIDFKIKLYNHVLHHLTGVSEEDRKSRTFRELFINPEKENVFELYKKTVETGEAFSFEYYSPQINGWLHLAVVQLGDGFLVILSDISLIKNSQEAFQQQSNYLNNILNASLNGIYVLEAAIGQDNKIDDFTFLQGNQRYAELTGRSIENLIGHSFLSLFPYAKENGLFHQFQEVINTDVSVRIDDYYSPAFDRWYDITIVKLGEKRLVVTFQEITEQRELAIKMAEQTKLLNNILKHSSNGISVGEMIRDASYKIIDIKTIVANDAAVRFTGISKDVYLSKTAGELDPSFLSSPYFKKCVQSMETGEPFITQYYLEAVGRWMEVSVSKMDEAHQIYIFTDVTTIKEAQLAIERSEEKLQMIINRSQSGILTATAVEDEEGQVVDFRFVIVNRALGAYLNQEPERLVGELGSKWFTGYKTNGLFELFYDSYTNKTLNRIDFHYEADGIDAWIDLMCTRFGDEIMITFTDYTPIKKLQLELQSSVDELKRSNRYLEDFAHAASHDMKEPLRKIRTFTDRLKFSMGPRMEENEKTLFERVETAAERMQHLVDDLLEFSHVSEQPQDMEPVDLNDKVTRVLADLDLPMEEKGAQVQFNTLPTVKGHKRQLQQLFHNLIGNALKYSKPDVPPKIKLQARVVKGDEVTIALSEDKKTKLYHCIEVKDNGIGFEQQYAEQIFNMFQRLHGKAEFPGTGIGLSIARKVVENHQGYIWAQSKLGEGATFVVLLPVE